MKKSLNIIIFFTIIILLVACASDQRRMNMVHTQLLAQVTAVYKSIEVTNPDEINLVFRKIDDCRYIIFTINKTALQNLEYKFFIEDNNVYTSNPELINLRFTIDYSEEIHAKSSDDNGTVRNRIIAIKRTPSDRFSAAGFASDIETDDFMIKLKEYIRTDCTEKLAEIIAYPFTAKINRKRMTIRNHGSFVRNYKLLFNHKLREAILNQSPADIKATAGGLELAGGRIRLGKIGGRLLITGINNA